WKTSVVTASAVFVICLIGLAHLTSVSESIENWISNLHVAFAPGGWGDTGSRNPLQAGLINFQYPLGTVISKPSIINGMAWSTGLILSIPALYILSQKPSHIIILDCVSILVIVQLLLLYHRTYDAILLVFPMAWALSPTVSPSQSWPLMFLTALFFLPSGQ